MRFTAYGHPNILATHKTTFEFTREKELTLKGDCIIGIKADFTAEDLKEVLKAENINIIVGVGDDKIEATAKVNPDFSSKEEIVIRKSDFISERTLGTNCDKAAIDFEHLVGKLKNPDQKIEVEIIQI